MAPNKQSGKTFWGRIRALFRVKETPAVVAGSIAAAVGWSTAPFFVGALGLPLTIWLFRLNKVLAVSLTVILFANPFMLLLMMFQVWLGLVFLGTPNPYDIIREIELTSLVKTVNQSKHLLVAYAVGGYSVAASAGAATLAILWPYLEWRKGRKAGRGKKTK